MASVPRNFKLLDELEDAEKSSKGGADISLGLSRPDDTFMSDWQASIFTTGGRGGEPRLFFATLHCDKDYPKTGPAIKLTSKVSLECVDATGKVNPAKLPYLATWNSGKSMYGALNELKNAIATSTRLQPPDGHMY